MKGDFTKDSFDEKKKYTGVRMQQGRSQLDADWNELGDILCHKIESGAADIVGGCGAPLGSDGFKIVASDSDLPEEDQALAPPPTMLGDFLITAGRMYVDGIPCRSDQIERYLGQQDFPGASGLDSIQPTDSYIAYLDVWTQHVTALDDPDIREVALGGPDTATRTRTVCQVKLKQLGGDVKCGEENAEWADLIAPPTGRLAARVDPGGTSDDPCIIPPGGGYRRLENQLYRVEVHDGGPLGTATFKWSRDNGSVLLPLSSLSNSGTTLHLPDGSADASTLLAPGDWLEVTDETHELNGLPGLFVNVVELNGTTITVDTAVTDIDMGRNPRMRLWNNDETDGLLVPTDPTAWLELEDGVQVRCSEDQLTTGVDIFRTGDYWLIPARVETANVEWPVDSASEPLSLSPQGVEHHYCRLAVLRWIEGDTENDAGWEIDDCRQIFPPVTELTSLFYLGGDGQEINPDPTDSDAFLPLPAKLRVGVANGEHPVQGASVEFSIVQGNGQLTGGSPSVILTTDDQGVAECDFLMDSLTAVQAVDAHLLKPDGSSTHLTVRFSETLSTATGVAYDPGDCPKLPRNEITTVDEALNRLCTLFDAVHVDYDPSCEKLPAGEVQNVKQALDRLCALLTADSIDYSPSCVRLALADVDNVQQALDELCDSLEAQFIEYTSDCTGLTDVQNVKEALDTLCQLVNEGSGGSGGPIVIDPTLNGTGTVATPLGINLANPNVWTGTQTFENVEVVGDTDLHGELNIHDRTVVNGEIILEGRLTARATGNTIGDGTAARQLSINGTADAVIGNTLAGNPTVWDLAVEGDVVVTGLIKSGGSLWIDGRTAGNHQIIANDAFNIGTSTTHHLSFSTNDTTAILVDGASQDVSVHNSLAVHNHFSVDNATVLGGDLTVEGNAKFNGATVLSYSPDNGEGIVPSDVTVYKAVSSVVTLPSSAENGQVLYLINSLTTDILVNGAVNALTSSAGEVEGHSMLNGMYSEGANSLVNGAANGIANGVANGSTNGHVNGTHIVASIENAAITVPAKQVRTFIYADGWYAQ